MTVLAAKMVRFKEKGSDSTTPVTDLHCTLGSILYKAYWELCKAGDKFKLELPKKDPL